jgi:hypothetical protein
MPSHSGHPSWAPFIVAGHDVHPSVALEFHRPSRDADPRTVHLVSDIHNLWECETLRRAHRLRRPRALAADLFIWGSGDPPNPAATKVGGMPWWPRGLRWPLIGGREAMFLAQFNFADSIDLMPPLPGRVLSLFVRDDQFFYDPSESVVGVWHTGEASELTTVDECPRPNAHVLRAFAARYRSFDNPPPTALARLRALFQDDPFWKLHVLQATKFGGRPWDPQRRSPSVPEDCFFLGSLSSIQPSLGRSWGWFNREEPIPLDALLQPGREPTSLILGDLDALNVFLHRSGRIVSTGGLS